MRPLNHTTYPPTNSAPVRVLSLVLGGNRDTYTGAAPCPASPSARFPRSLAGPGACIGGN